MSSTVILGFRVGTSENKITDHWVKGTRAIISLQVTYETDHIFLLCDSNALNFCFYLFYCNLKEKYLIKKIINSKKKIFIWDVSIFIILIYRKFGSVGPVQQKIKLPSPKTMFVLEKEFAVVVRSETVDGLEAMLE